MPYLWLELPGLMEVRSACGSTPLPWVVRSDRGDRVLGVYMDDSGTDTDVMWLVMYVSERERAESVGELMARTARALIGRETHWRVTAQEPKGKWRALDRLFDESGAGGYGSSGEHSPSDGFDSRAVHCRGRRQR